MIAAGRSDLSGNKVIIFLDHRPKIEQESVDLFNAKDY